MDQNKNTQGQQGQGQQHTGQQKPPNQGQQNPPNQGHQGSRDKENWNTNTQSQPTRDQADDDFQSER